MKYGEYYMGDGLDIPLEKKDLPTDKFDYLKGDMARRVEKKAINWINENLEGNEQMKKSYRIKTDPFEDNSKMYWYGNGINTAPIIAPFVEEEGYQICGTEELGEALGIPGLRTDNHSYTLGVVVRPEAPNELPFEQELRDMVMMRGFDPKISPVYIPAKSLEARVDKNSSSGVSVKLKKGALPRYMPALDNSNNLKRFNELTLDGPAFSPDGKYQAHLASKGVTKVAFGGQKLWADLYNLTSISGNERVLLKKK